MDRNNDISDMNTRQTCLNVGVATPFDVCQVGGAIDGGTISETVTSHFKSFSHLYNQQYVSFCYSRRVQFWRIFFYSLTKIMFIHAHIYLLESVKSFLGQEKKSIASFLKLE